MPYFIETTDKPGHQQVRQQHRQDHLRYLDENKELLLACGAKLNEDGTDAGGGLYIVDVETLGSPGVHQQRSLPQRRQSFRNHSNFTLAQSLC
jgi:uncharacterized protein YciI